MNITPSQTGYEHIMVFLAIQGAKEGIITSEYSGTMRLADYVAPEAFIKKCIDAWCLYALGTYPSPPAGELLFAIPTLATGDTDAKSKGYNPTEPNLMTLERARQSDEWAMSNGDSAYSEYEQSLGGNLQISLK
ncbi:hypothetical protein selz497L_178 [Salmonella phage SenALZ1]|nr:hypothetical protein selz232L_178 [Salmonella phage SenALZ1]QZB90146.1 hypothetical protein selz497L_178 [Salmonella phage SenALZ1]